MYESFYKGTRHGDFFMGLTAVYNEITFFDKPGYYILKENSTVFLNTSMLDAFSRISLVYGSYTTPSPPPARLKYRNSQNVEVVIDLESGDSVTLTEEICRNGKIYLDLDGRSGQWAGSYGSWNAKVYFHEE